MEKIRLSLSNVAASLRRTLYVDALVWNLLDKPSHRVKVGFIEGEIKTTSNMGTGFLSSVFFSFAKVNKK